MEKELNTLSVNLKRAFVESMVSEFGRTLRGLVLLINEEEIANVQAVHEGMLNDTWEAAQKPLLEALIKEL